MNPEDKMRELGSRDNATPSEAEWLEFRSRGRRSVRNRRIAGAVGSAGLLLALVVGWYVLTAQEPGVDRDNPIAPATSPGSEESPSDEPTPVDEPTLGTTGDNPVQVWFVQGDKLHLTHQLSDDTTFVNALQRLLGGVPGPVAETTDPPVRSAIPPGTDLIDFELRKGHLKVNFTPFSSNLDELDQNLAIEQILLTAMTTRDNGIDSVQIFEDGSVLTGHPFRRKDLEDFLPPIVVETPHSGQDIQGPFELTGIANVFEATVSWRLIDSEGKLVKEGFTTATCGTGCWGTFEDVVKYDVLSGAGTLQIFESSAEDGSPLHMVEVPLIFH